MARLLIVDDEPSISWGLSQLGRSLGHEVAAAASAEEAIEQAAQKAPEVIVLDVRLPGLDGLSAMGHLRELAPAAPIIVMTAYGDLETAVEAVRNGAFEYVLKPFDLDQMESVWTRALANRTAVAAAHSDFDAGAAGMMGRSPTMQEAFRRIALAAAAESCVLISGESGTGKELAARAVHRYSRRANGPFVAINISALSPTLVESELFGHVRGAFTGAESTRPGMLAQANGGSLFLDEVADIPLPVQVKLLRVLEQGEHTPVGGNSPEHSDFRLISATHQNLLSLVQAGKFRHDLYFRLCTFQIELPPLRERQGDVRLLAESFIHQFAAAQSAPRPTLSPAALARLEAAPWYGNVRELRSAIEHALIVARGATLEADHLPAPVPRVSLPATVEDPQEALIQHVRRWSELHLRNCGDEGKLYDDLLRILEPPLFTSALAASQGQCATAARKLGLHRTTLRKKLDEYGLEPGRD